MATAKIVDLHALRDAGLFELHETAFVVYLTLLMLADANGVVRCREVALQRHAYVRRRDYFAKAIRTLTTPAEDGWLWVKRQGIDLWLLTDYPRFVVGEETDEEEQQCVG